MNKYEIIASIFATPVLIALLLPSLVMFIMGIIILPISIITVNKNFSFKRHFIILLDTIKSFYRTME